MVQYYGANGEEIEIERTKESHEEIILGKRSQTNVRFIAKKIDTNVRELASPANKCELLLGKVKQVLKSSDDRTVFVVNETDICQVTAPAASGEDPPQVKKVRLPE